MFLRNVNGWLPWRQSFYIVRMVVMETGDMNGCPGDGRRVSLAFLSDAPHSSLYCDAFDCLTGSE